MKIVDTIYFIYASIMWLSIVIYNNGQSHNWCINKNNIVLLFW